MAVNKRKQQWASHITAIQYSMALAHPPEHQYTTYIQYTQQIQYSIVLYNTNILQQTEAKSAEQALQHQHGEGYARKRIKQLNTTCFQF